MPALPAGLSEWLAPGVYVGVVVLLFGALNKRMDDMNKRMDDLRTDQRASEARQQEALRAIEERQQEALRAIETRQQEALRAMETRQREEIRELRSDMKSLGDKVDRLVESLAAAKSL